MNSSFVERGGLWVVGQSVLMLLVIVLATIYRGERTSAEFLLLGGVLIAIGACFGLMGMTVLRGNRTAFPKPRERSRLIQHGIYAHVRHPLYTSVILVCAGWALIWGSWVAFLLALALVPFFYAKATVEERWLRLKFPEYAGYERRVRRFVPGRPRTWV